MADNPIDLTKIFNFSDTTPLDQVIVKTQQLNGVLDTMLQTAQKSAAGMVQSMQAIQKSVESLEEEISQADATTKKGQDTISQGAQTTAKAVSQNEEYKKSLADLQTVIKTLQDQIDKLSESNKKLPKDNDDQKNSLADLRKQLKDATDAYIKMGDATDASVKQKALKNIQDLGKATADASKALNDAKKGTDIASGSYNDLALKVANATKQLKAMEGGVGSTSQKFKDLQKFVADGNEKLKAFDQSIGVANRNVGNYQEAIEKAIPAFKTLSPVLIESAEAAQILGTKLLALLANPIVLGLAALVAAFALLKKSIETYTEGTIEGADRANVFAQSWSTALEVVNAKFKSLGKSVVDFADEHSEGMKATLFAMNPVIGGLVKLITSSEEYQTRLKANIEIAKMQNDLRKEEIELITEVSELDLSKEKEMFAARDKENRSLQERYDAILKVNEIRKEEIGLKQKAAQAEFDIQAAYFKKIGVIVDNETKIKDLFENEIVIQKKAYDQVEELAKARAKITDVEKEEFEGTRRIQALKNQLIEESIANILAGQEEEKAIRDKFNLQQIQDQQTANNRILASQGSEINERIDAETKNLYLVQKINEKGLADELAAHRKQALQRVILDHETNEKITAQAGDDLELRARLIIDVKNEILNQDEAFQSQSLAIQKTWNSKQEDEAYKSAQRMVQINIEAHKKFAEAQGSSSGVSSDRELQALDRSLQNREISINKYNLERQRLENEAKNDQIEIQNDLLRKELSEFTATKDLELQHADDINQIRKKLADNELQIEDNNTKIILEKRKRLHDQEKQFANQTFDSIMQIADNETQGKIDAIEYQIKLQQDEYSRESALASGNQTLKIQLANQFAEKQAQLAKQEAKLKHDQAVRDRDLSEAKIVINTAVAVSEVLPNLIAAALIGAAGALQLAVVASTPIPAYFTGTAYSKEGLALVGERGSELGIDRSGKVDLYDKPQITYLNEGTKILNAAETEPILKKINSKDMDVISHQLVDIGIRDLKINQGVNREIITKLDNLNETTKKNRPTQVNYAKVGATVYEFKKEEEGYLRRVKALSFGSWL